MASYGWILDSSYLPHSIIQLGIRRQLAQRKAEIRSSSHGSAYQAKMDFISELRTQGVAIQTEAANEQHYEVGTDLMANFLGPKMTYSCCLYPDRSTTLEQAEIEMLDQYVQKADIGDGMSIFDMGLLRMGVGQYFFTGGTMASADLLYFQDDLRLRNQWWLSGNHYATTCEDWLTRMIQDKKKLWPHLIETYGEKDAASWSYRWQIFFMACAELFASDYGDTWGICQYFFEKPAA